MEPRIRTTGEINGIIVENLLYRFCEQTIALVYNHRPRLLPERGHSLQSAWQPIRYNARAIKCLSAGRAVRP